MKRNKFKLSVLLLPVFLWSMLAYPCPQAIASTNEIFPVSKMVIGPFNGGITIKVTNSSLGKVLQRISEQSNIRFKFFGSLADLPITAGIQGKDWDSVVKELLRDYGMVQIMSKSGHLTEVFILRASDKDSVETFNNNFSQSNKNSRAIGKITHTENQLRVIGRGPYRAPLQAKLFTDPQYRGFLVQNGIKTIEDLKDREKAKHVRWVARRFLKEKMKRNRAKNKVP